MLSSNYSGIHECTSDGGTNRKTRSRFAKNNLVRIIVGVKRAGNLIEKIGVTQTNC